MTLKLTLFSQEVEDYVLELKIDSEAKFKALHQLILSDCHYQEHPGQSFLICDEDWCVKEHIRLTDTGNISSDEDINLMERTSLRDFLEEEGQRLAYIFDPEGKRFFLMELTENIFGQTQKEPKVSKRHGTAPQQFLREEVKVTRPTESYAEMDESFYGDDGFEEDEIDMEGFEIND